MVLPGAAVVALGSCGRFGSVLGESLLRVRWSQGKGLALGQCSSSMAWLDVQQGTFRPLCSCVIINLQF